MPQSPLELLRRSDKWYIGSGDGLVWAPPFPAWHDTPGYWDEAHLVQYPVGPLFSIAFVRAGESQPFPRARSMEWSPTELTLRYELGSNLRGVEIRSAPGDRVLASQWELRNSGRIGVTVDLVLWTAVDGESVGDDGVVAAEPGVRLTRTVRDRKDQELVLDLDYELEDAGSWAAYRSESSGPVPNFSLTPFYDRWQTSGKLANTARLGGINRRGLVYLALARRVRIGAGHSTQFTASVKVSPAAISVPVSSPSGPRPAKPLVRSQRAWSVFAAGIPTFVCSDPWLNRYWWYRWYGLRLNAIPAGLGHYRSPTVCEGIGYFHQPISYSAMCHAREVRWTRDPNWSYGVVETFLDRIGDDGAMPGRVYLDHLRETDFYHADWGGVLQDVAAVHPDPARLQSLYPALERYAGWLLRGRDGESSGMIDVIDQYETGQEYMSRYQAVDPSADQYGWENRLRLKGIDVSVYAYRLFQLLAAWAPTDTGRHTWGAQVERTRLAIVGRMWDPEQGMFFDVNPASGERTGAKAAVCFYPYLTDLIGAEHIEGLGRHLFNPGEFWTPFPAPSSSVDDALYSADAEWKGKRHVCPWNGRVWPMTNSHLIDALARVTRRHRPDWAPRVVAFTNRFVQMMCFDGDAARPNSFEHYHPETGKGSIYRGIDDYQHSWVNDLLVRHVAGLLPRGDDGIVVDPMPFGVNVSLTGAVVAGHSVDVAVSGAGFTVRVNGKSAGRGKVGVAREIAW
ncbi:MAG: hypothetical protein ABI679_05675 [Gemmatimonadota bacterium]